MSFMMKTIFGREEENKDGEEDEEDATSEESASTESADTGVFTSLNGDLDANAHLEADCSTISNFFGYWYVLQ